MIVLNVIAAVMIFPYAPGSQFTKIYIAMMWRVGPVAFGSASAMFFVLIRWAVRLTRMDIPHLPTSETPA